MMQKCFPFFLLLVFSFPLLAENFEARKEKYWVYRERLKNFMVINSSSQGCSIPAAGRERETTNANGQVIAAGLGWGDSPWFMGYWVGTLAMEYNLLAHSKADLTQTKRDLYDAIQAINRIDCQAEASWGGSSCYIDCGTGPGQALNGFLVRDDVPNFLHTIINNETVEDQLNEGWVPPHDSWRAKCINSAFTSYLNPGGEASQDHLIGLFIGLTLVRKCITDVNESFGNQTFSDGEKSFVREVQNISDRITTYLAANHGHGITGAWYYTNACEGHRCVLGVDNPHYDNPCVSNPIVPSTTQGPCIKGDEGAIAFPQAIGFASTNAFIQTGSSHAPVANAIAIRLCLTGVYRIAWNAALAYGNSGRSRLALTLEALGSIGTISNGGILCPLICTLIADDRATIALTLATSGEKYNWEHLILLNRFVYGDQYYGPRDSSAGDIITISDQHYECLLDAAPCRGFDGLINSGQIVEWSDGDRLGGGRGRTDVSVEAHNGIDYMFYFNLYYSTLIQSNPRSPYASANYAPIPINNLAPAMVTENEYGSIPYVELDKRQFMASNQITGQKYEITTDAVSGDKGRVTFVAGNQIHLVDGFKVTNGGYFHGYIDHAIQPMTCVQGNGDCSAVH